MPPRRWTTEELDIANKMLNSGASFVEIGKTIDRSGAAVEAKLKGQSTQKTAGAKNKPKPEPQTVLEVGSVEAKSTKVEEKPIPPQPQQAKPDPTSISNDDEREGSTVKYIVGAVIVAVVIYFLFGD